MAEIKLTREEKKALKEYLYSMLCDMCEYHADLNPQNNDSLDTLVEKYCYWANEYNDGYMSQMDDSDNKLSAYMVQEYNRLYKYSCLCGY